MFCPPCTTASCPKEKRGLERMTEELFGRGWLVRRLRLRSSTPRDLERQRPTARRPPKQPHSKRVIFSQSSATAGAVSTQPKLVVNLQKGKKMSATYLTTDELAERIKYEARTIRDSLKDNVLFEGIHYFRPFGGRKVLYIWEAIEKDMMVHSSVGSSSKGGF